MVNMFIYFSTIKIYFRGKPYPSVCNTAVWRLVCAGTMYSTVKSPPTNHVTYITVKLRHDCALVLELS